MEMLFEKLLKKILLKEAPDESIDDEEDTGNINFDLEDQDLPEEGDMGPSAAMSNKINTPQELDLISIAILALSYNGPYNKNVFSLFESGQAQPEKVLNYIESMVGQPELDDEVILAILGGGGELNFDPSPIIGKPIASRLKFYEQNVVSFPQDRIRFWTRIILNCLKYDGNDYSVTLQDLDETNVDAIYDKLKQDFNVDSTGTFSSFIKDTPEGSNLKGPGVF